MGSHTCAPAKVRREALQMFSLLHVRKLILVIDRACKVVSCTQSRREIYEAWQQFVPMFVWPHVQINLQRLLWLVRIDERELVKRQVPAQHDSSAEITPAADIKVMLRFHICNHATAFEAATFMRTFELRIAWEVLWVCVCRYFQQNWYQLLTPWNTLRVFATAQLRALMQIRLIWYFTFAGATALFNSWYRRFEPDTFTMYALGIGVGAVGFLTTCCVKHLVVRYGDLRGIWLPANVFMVLYALGTVLVPQGYLHLFYFIWPLLGGPGMALSGFAPELVSKLIPPDVQGTFQTAKSFLFNIQQAVLMWPFLGLYHVSESLPHPFDGLAIWVGMGLGMISLWLLIRQFPTDPQVPLVQGQALEPYWDSSYVHSKWYRQHGGWLHGGWLHGLGEASRG